ncbi:ArsR/SmtB family transcription factor [Streptomyces achromogenes]|uniref:ArsR/SmtB family transcription factor n=1 Tax=Streptomyces achromogenes TaxID=67255 RepID=UPI003400629D
MEQRERGDAELAAVLRALGDPVRLALIRRMAEDGESACSPDGLDVPRSTLSHHWRILREAGITETRRAGKARLMTLRRAVLDVRFPGTLRRRTGRSRAKSAHRARRLLTDVRHLPRTSRTRSACTSARRAGPPWRARWSGSPSPPWLTAGPERRSAHPVPSRLRRRCALGGGAPWAGVRLGRGRTGPSADHRRVTAGPAQAGRSAPRLSGRP